MKRVDALALEGRRVLVRVDFNVPLDEHGEVASDARIEAALPTIEHIRARAGRPILMSHLGRPKGKVVDSLRMLAVAERLQELTQWRVRAVPQCTGELVKDLALSLEEGEVLVLENLRFDPREEKGDEGFGRELADLAELFVNDAFGTCHRAHASVAVVPRFLPSACGFLLAREIEAFQKVLEAPERPLVAILGGAKVSDKLPVIQNLLPRVDRLLVGGGMAYTFLKAEGVHVGRSLVEEDLVGAAKAILESAAAQGKVVALPEDHLASVRFEHDSPYEILGPDIPDNLMGMDIGPKSRKRYAELLADARTIVWNGPMGVFEFDQFCRGTEKVAEAVARSDAFTVVGGGDSVAALEQLRLVDQIDHVSTGGGASLELLEGKTLPGIAALA